MRAAERIYRWLLGSYPAAFRERYADEMTRLFIEQLTDAVHGRGRRGEAVTWARSIADLALTAPREHLRERRRVRRLVTGSDVTEATGRWSQAGILAVVLLPLVVAFLLWLAAPNFMQPMFDDRVALFGLPAGTVILVAAAAWLAFGARIALHWRTTPAVLVALLFFDLPALAIVILGPALVLVVINLTPTAGQ